LEPQWHSDPSVVQREELSLDSSRRRELQFKLTLETSVDVSLLIAERETSIDARKRPIESELSRSTGLAARRNGI
jgi:hypothetical protein